MPKSALVSGHTGLVGRCLTQMLVKSDQYDRVDTVGRRPLELSCESLNHHATELGQLVDSSLDIAPNDAFCCLGTTLKTAGSEAAFEQVDYHMVVDFARFAFKAGATRFFLVSSMSASEDSAFFYSRVKGRAEQAVRKLEFETVHIVRLSLLVGDRDEFRLGEMLGQKLMVLANPLLQGGLRKYRAIRAEEVAAAMLKLAADTRTGAMVHCLPLED